MASSMIAMRTEAKRILEYAYEVGDVSRALEQMVENFHEKWSIIMDSMEKSCEIENYGTEEDFEYMKYHALMTHDYEVFRSMTGRPISKDPFSYFPKKTLKKFQIRYLLEAMEDIEENKNICVEVDYED